MYAVENSTSAAAKSLMVPLLYTLKMKLTVKKRQYILLSCPYIIWQCIIFLFLWKGSWTKGQLHGDRLHQQNDNNSHQVRLSGISCISTYNIRPSKKQAISDEMINRCMSEYRSIKIIVHSIGTLYTSASASTTVSRSYWLFSFLLLFAVILLQQVVTAMDSVMSLLLEDVQNWTSPMLFGRVLPVSHFVLRIWNNFFQN